MHQCHSNDEQESEEPELTALFGSPTDQETMQYVTPSRRCTTETKLQRGHRELSYQSIAVWKLLTGKKDMINKRSKITRQA